MRACRGTADSQRRRRRLRRLCSGDKRATRFEHIYTFCGSCPYSRRAAKHRTTEAATPHLEVIFSNVSATLNVSRFFLCVYPACLRVRRIVAHTLYGSIESGRFARMRLYMCLRKALCEPVCMDEDVNGLPHSTHYYAHTRTRTADRWTQFDCNEY